MITRKLLAFVLLALLVLCLAASTDAQRNQQRDHLSGMEADLVRDAQLLDKRTEVFVRAIERRMLALTDPQAAAETKQVKKEMEAWGPLPAGSRFELFSDIASILDEAITNIDDFSNRSATSELLPKALRKLSDASSRLMTQIEPLRATSRGPEREALGRITEHVETILEAAKKLPTAPTKK